LRARIAGLAGSCSPAGLRGAIVTVIDVTEADFEREVLDRSQHTPVVVDFWAEWCAPCRSLGPLLEHAAGAREGQVVLAKLDTDANPNLARRFEIRGIPAVKAFAGGGVVDEFVGVQPQPAVERFFDALLPSEADALVQEGGQVELERALELEPGRSDAAIALARLLIARGEHERALAVLANVTGSFQADGLAARLGLRDDGRYTEAFAALDAGESAAGLQALITALPAAGEQRDDVRRVIVGELVVLGPEHPLSSETRRQLAAALF
jgi:putative thioredoxin